VDPYARLARYLASNQPVYGLQAPIDIELVAAAEQSFGTLEEMAAHYVQVISDIDPIGPYQLGGYSYGGNVAFEMAHQLLKAGRKVSVVAVLDSMPRLKPGTVDNVTDCEIVIQRIRSLENGYGVRDRIVFDRLDDLPEKDKLKHVVEMLLEAKRIPPEYNLAAIEAMIQRTRVRMLCLERYAPKVYPGRVTLFYTQEQNPEEKIAGWRNLSAESLETCAVPGDHHSMVQEPCVQILGRELQRVLNAARIGDTTCELASKPELSAAPVPCKLETTSIQ
jgi:thioesterase domain-containing protein